MKLRHIRTLTLLILLAINLSLGAVLFYLRSDPDTAASLDQEIDRVKLLYLQNGYELLEEETELPDRPLKLETQDLEDRGDDFFETSEKSYLIGSEIQYTSGQETLVVDRETSSMTYTNSGTGTGAGESIGALAGDMADRLLGGADHELIQRVTEQGRTIYVYCQLYKGQRVLCNQAVIRVRNGAIESAAVTQYKIKGYGASVTEYPLDEVLYGCLTEFRQAENVGADQELTELRLLSGWQVFETGSGSVKAMPALTLTTASGKTVTADLVTLELRNLQY